MKDTFSKLLWLKRTDGHEFKPSEFRVLIAVFNHSNKDGRRSFPGIEILMKETGLKHAAISAAGQALVKKGWFHERFRGCHGSNSEWDLVPDAPNPDYRCDSDRGAKCFTCKPKGSTLVDPSNDKGSMYVDPSEDKESTDTSKGSMPVMKGSTFTTKGSTDVDTIRSSLTDHRTDHRTENDTETLDESPTTKGDIATPNGVAGAATNVAADPVNSEVDQGQNPDPFDDVPFDVPTETPNGVEGVFTLQQSRFLTEAEPVTDPAAVRLAVLKERLSAGPVKQKDAWSVLECTVSEAEETAEAAIAAGWCELFIDDEGFGPAVYREKVVT